MAHSTGHKHADAFGFVLMEGGRKVFVDSGKYGYNDGDEATRRGEARRGAMLSVPGHTIYRAWPAARLGRRI